MSDNVNTPLFHAENGSDGSFRARGRFQHEGTTSQTVSVAVSFLDLFQKVLRKPVRPIAASSVCPILSTLSHSIHYSTNRNGNAPKWA